MNYRTNEDKRSSTCGTFNAIHNVEDITGSGDVTEPVSLQDTKDYLRLENASPDDSPADEFDFDDSLISSLIIEGRIWAEKFTGVHFVPKTLEVTLTNGVGMMRIPGPVTGAITWKDQDGTTITAARLIGALFPKIESETCDRQVLQYEAGYGTDCPEWAKNAILAYVADHYEHRGDDKAPAPNERAAMILRPYRFGIKMFS